MVFYFIYEVQWQFGNKIILYIFMDNFVMGQYFQTKFDNINITTITYLIEFNFTCRGWGLWKVLVPVRRLPYLKYSKYFDITLINEYWEFKHRILSRYMSDIVDYENYIGLLGTHLEISNNS